MRLLLADDNEMNVDLFSAALEQHDVVVERDGAAALRRALSKISDIHSRIGFLPIVPLRVRHAGHIRIGIDLRSCHQQTACSIVRRERN